MIFGFGHCRIWALSAVGPSRIEMANGNSISAGLYTDCELFLYGGWRRSFRGQTIVIDSCKFQQSPPPPPSQRRPLSLSPIQPRVQSLHCPAPNFVSAIPPPYARKILSRSRYNEKFPLLLITQFDFLISLDKQLFPFGKGNSSND